LPEYIEKDYKINADYFYDIEVLFDNSNQYLVFVIVSKQDSTKKLAYLYFDFEKNKVFASDLAVWQ
jgi:hypothetical protein